MLELRDFAFCFLFIAGGLQKHLHAPITPNFWRMVMQLRLSTPFFVQLHFPQAPFGSDMSGVSAEEGFWSLLRLGRAIPCVPLATLPQVRIATKSRVETDSRSNL